MPTAPAPPPRKSRAAPYPANPAALPLAHAIAAILTTIAAYVGTRLHILGDITHPLHRRIIRAMRRIQALLARAAAGRAPRFYPPRIRAPHPHQAIPPLPRRRLWLVEALGYNVAGYASQLSHLLAHPESQSALAAAPAETRAAIARALRPLARALGIEFPAILAPASPPAPPRRKPTRPKPARASRPPDPPSRPLPAYLRATIRAWNRKPA